MCSLQGLQTNVYLGGHQIADQQLYPERAWGVHPTASKRDSEESAVDNLDINARERTGFQRIRTLGKYGELTPVNILTHHRPRWIIPLPKGTSRATGSALIATGSASAGRAQVESLKIDGFYWRCHRKSTTRSGGNTTRSEKRGGTLQSQASHGVWTSRNFINPLHMIQNT